MRFYGRFHWLLAVLVLTLGNSSLAQNLPYKVLETPRKYRFPSDEKDLSLSNERIQGSPWRVWSDRFNNPTFREPDLVLKVAKLDFLAELYVVEETERALRVIGDQNLQPDLTLSQDAMDLGWISKEKVLLWEHCLVTKQGRIDRKAMIINSLESLTTIEMAPDQIRYRRGPNETYEELGTVTLFDLLYVYKSTSEAVLLGRASIAKQGNEKKIIGWVSRNSLAFWDTRIALEPNLEPEAMQERADGVKPTFFVDRRSARMHAQGRKISPRYILWQDDFGSTRPPGEFIRFPLLGVDKSDPNILTAGVIATVSESSTGKISELELANLNARLAQLTEMKKKINIVFVVDGTSSIRPYFPAISEAISTSIHQLTQENTSNAYRFGAVVYRDFSEGPNLIEKTRLSADIDEVISFFRQVKAYETMDQDVSEAVFFGLKNALMTIGFRENESNVVILIGDAGNHYRDDASQVDAKEIVKLLTNFSAHFLAVQIKSGDHPSYSQFVNQTQSLMMEAALKAYSEYTKSGVSLSIDKPRFEYEQNKLNLINSPLSGWIIAQSPGEHLEPTSLSTTIEDFIFSMENTTNGLVEVINRIREGSSLEDTEAFSKGIEELLRLYGLRNTEIQHIKQRRVKLMVRGYAPMYVANQEAPLFKPVILLSRLELGRLALSLDKIRDSFTSANMRESLFDLWTTLLNLYTGEHIGRAEIASLSIGELQQRVLGLPINNTFLHQLTLENLMDESPNSDRLLSEFAKNIALNGEKVHEILYADSYPYSFISNDQMFYWIPEETLHFISKPRGERDLLYLEPTIELVASFPYQTIYATETADAQVTIKNTSNVDAEDILIFYEIDNPQGKGIEFPLADTLEKLEANSSMLLPLPISATREVATTDWNLKISVKEKGGDESVQQILPFTTQEFLPPDLKFDNVRVDDTQFGNKDYIIQENEFIKLIFEVKNEGKGNAEQVNIALTLADTSGLASSTLHYTISKIAPGTASRIETEPFLASSKLIRQAKLPILVQAKERWEEFGFERSLDLELEKDLRKGESLRDLLDTFFRPSKSWAVVIGINDYSQEKNGKGFKNLPYAVADADSFKSYLINYLGFSDDRIYECYNQNATKRQIQRILGDELPRKVKREDRVLVFFSGHGFVRGTEEGYLMPIDGEHSNAYSTCISDKSIKDFSELINAREMLFIIDSCHSGLFGTEFSKGKRKQEIPKDVLKQAELFQSSSGRQMLTAGASTETAVMHERWDNHSVFTYYLLNGLKGSADKNRDDVVTASELHEYVNSKVSDETQQKQNPQIFRLNGEGEFVFYPEGLK